MCNELLPPDVKMVRIVPSDVLIISNLGSALTMEQAEMIKTFISGKTDVRNVLLFSSDIDMTVVRELDDETLL